MKLNLTPSLASEQPQLPVVHFHSSVHPAAAVTGSGRLGCSWPLRPQAGNTHVRGPSSQLRRFMVGGSVVQLINLQYSGTERGAQAGSEMGRCGHGAEQPVVLVPLEGEPELALGKWHA